MAHPLRTIGLWSLTVFCGLLLASSEGRETSIVVKAQIQSIQQHEFRHSFECPASEALQGVVKRIHFEGDRASEETEPYVGAFFTSTIVFDMQDGRRESIQLFDPLHFSSEKPGKHTACQELVFHKIGSFIFFEHIGEGGNPYPPQQLMFLNEATGGFSPTSELHPLIGQDFTEFETNGCLAALRHGDGLVNRICYIDSKFVIRSALLQEQYQKSGWHTFLCDFSDDGIKIAEYAVKSSVHDYTEDLDPIGSMEKMLDACRLSLTKFNEQTVPRS